MEQDQRSNLPEEIQPDIRPDLPGLRALENNAGESEGGATDSTAASDGGATSGTGGRRSSYSNRGGAVSQSPSATSSSAGLGVGGLAAAEAAGGLYSATNATGGLGAGGRIKQRVAGLNKRKALIGGGATATIVGLVFSFFTFSSGPLQFVHFAQLLQQFHMRSNEDFGDDRSSKVLLYALTGKGAERGRLGITGNKAADVWEKKLLEETGLRPAYSETTRRFVGFEIVDEDKAFNALDASDGKSRASIERTMGKGAEIRTVSEASAGKQNIVRGGTGERLAGDTRIIDLSSVKDFAQRARFIKTIGSLTDTNRISSSVASRLLIKRAGVDFHPLKNLKRKSTDKVADYREKRRAEKAEQERTGTQSTSVADTPDKTPDGASTQTPDQASATKDANSAIDAAKASPGESTLKSIAGKLGKGGAALGVLCAARSIGDDIPKYKYANDVLPMERMGMSAITVGNQVMSDKDVNLDELGALSESFRDKDTNTTWTSARSIQGELGQEQNGPDLPREAQLKNANDKPAFFDILDSVPVLGTACGATSAIGNLPIIKQVSGLTSDAALGALNAVAGQFGTSTDSIMGSALAAVSGQSVNTLASGAEYGNLANTGAFLAANDNAISMGGVPLSNTDVATLKSEEQVADTQDTANESVAERYLDPYNNHSLVASLIDKAPSSSSQVTALSQNVASTFSDSLKSLASLFAPKVHAATAGYDYGVAKYGFSAADRDNPEFEDPYENATVIEQPGVLDDLNAKYGKVCFGMTVTADDTGVHIQTESMGSDDLNVFKVQAKDECQPDKNKDPMFLRYRFYLADAVTANSLNCYEGSDTADQSCSDIGAGGSASASDSTSAAPDSSSASASGTLATGEAGDLAKQLLPYISQGKIKCGVAAGGSGSADCHDIQATASGQPIGGNCAVGSLTPHLLALILGLVKDDGWTLGISAICSDHHPEGDGPYAGHSYGSTADFSIQNGSAGAAAASDKKFVDDAAALLSSTGGSFGQIQCHPAYSSLSNSKFTTFNDTCNHQHIRAAP